MQGIYEIRNKVNGKYYVGSSKDAECRWGGHKRDLKATNHYNVYLQHAWSKYGEENFVFEFVEEILGGREARMVREQEYLDEGFAEGILYNLARVAGGGSLPGENHPMYGKHHTEEQKAKWSKERAGKNNPFYGKQQTEAAKAKTGRANSNPSKETRTKIGKAQMGHKMPEHVRAKLDIIIVGNEYNAQPYPAFYNVKTKEAIPAGKNLSKICQEYGLNYDAMWRVKFWKVLQTRDGWQLA